MRQIKDEGETCEKDMPMPRLELQVNQNFVLLFVMDSFNVHFIVICVRARARCRRGDVHALFILCYLFSCSVDK